MIPLYQEWKSHQKLVKQTKPKSEIYNSFILYRHQHQRHKTIDQHIAPGRHKLVGEQNKKTEIMTARR